MIPNVVSEKKKQHLLRFLALFFLNLPRKALEQEANSDIDHNQKD